MQYSTHLIYWADLLSREVNTRKHNVLIHMYSLKYKAEIPATFTYINSPATRKRAEG